LVLTVLLCGNTSHQDENTSKALRRNIIDASESGKVYKSISKQSKYIIPLSDGSSTNGENSRPLAIYLGQIVPPNSDKRCP
jgi:hypothetical protein